MPWRRTLLSLAALAALTALVSAGVLLGALLAERSSFEEVPLRTEGTIGDAVAGRRVFSQAGCGDCHSLESAGSTGTRGPDLDEHLSAHEHGPNELVERVEDGGVGMPPFKERLSEKQIRDVVAFVIESTRSGAEPGER